MSALIPPKHDLRGGKASADSFPMSISVFVASMKRRFVAGEGHELADAMIVRSHVHELGPIPFPLVVWRGFLRSLDMVESHPQNAKAGFVSVRNFEAPKPRGHLNCRSSHGVICTPDCGKGPPLDVVHNPPLPPNRGCEVRYGPCEIVESTMLKPGQPP